MYDDKGGVILENKITAGEVNQELTKQEKVVSLFKFIEELNKLICNDLCQEAVSPPMTEITTDILLYGRHPERVLSISSRHWPL